MEASRHSPPNKHQHKTSLYYSAGMHFALLVFAIFGLPSLFEVKKEPEPMVVTIEPLPVGKISNVKPSQKNPAPKKDPLEKPKPPTPKKTAPTKSEVEPEEKLEEKIKIPDKKEPLPKLTEKKPEEKKPQPKPKQEKPKEKPKPKKPKADDLDAVLKDLKESDTPEDDKKPEDKPEDSASDSTSKSDKYDETQPLSLSEVDAIRGQFVRCWRMPAGSKNDFDLSVHIHVTVAADGTVETAEIADSDKSRYGRDGAFRAAADSALRAVHKCSPLKNLTTDKYDTWKDMELNFDPKEMLY